MKYRIFSVGMLLETKIGLFQLFSLFFYLMNCQENHVSNVQTHNNVCTRVDCSLEINQTKRPGISTEYDFQ